MVDGPTPVTIITRTYIHDKQKQPIDPFVPLLFFSPFPLHALLPLLLSYAASWMHGLIAGDLVPYGCHAFTGSWQTNLNPTIQSKNLHNFTISSHGVHLTQAARSRSHLKARPSKHRCCTFEIRETFCVRGASQGCRRRKYQAASVVGEDELRWPENCFLGGKRL